MNYIFCYFVKDNKLTVNISIFISLLVSFIREGEIMRDSEREGEECREV